jgi:hypothetical protein
VLQYSVTASWETKIKNTVAKITKEFKEVSILIYVTNQLIGAKADNLRKSLLRTNRIFLDVRDQSWFLDRLNIDSQREAAAEELAASIVDPLLESRKIISRKAQALNDIETRAAFVFLELQWEDESRDRGLTRISFEALVRAVLRDTHSDNRMSRSEIYSRILAILPNHTAELVQTQIDSALRRLEKQVIRHWKSLDEFCLTHDERKRINNRLAEVERSDYQLQEEIREAVSKRVSYKQPVNDVDDVTERTRRVIENFLLSRGEYFVFAVKTSQYEYAKIEDVRNYIIRDINNNPAIGIEKGTVVEIILGAVQDIFNNPGEAIRQHLRTLTDAYTLLAFLRETPDVQAAVNKMFSNGAIWLDTNIVLPLFAETLVPEERRQFTTMIRAASEAGLDLYITSGVLEEIERHMNLSLRFVQMRWGVWEGIIPFLCSVYIQTGRSTHAFPNWLEAFRGNVRPEDDIADYLAENFQIKLFDLQEEVDSAPQDLRLAVQEVWQSTHERRRQRIARATDPLVAVRLANHDIENYLGVIHRRRNERNSPLGYSSWWVTLDKTAFGIEREVRQSHNIRVASPVMSPDFLMNYLALGPVRMRVSKQTEKILPVLLELRMTDTLDPELLSVANSVREQFKDLPEYVIRRRVRDALDAAKSRLGKMATGGLQAVEEELLLPSSPTE